MQGNTPKMKAKVDGVTAKAPGWVREFVAGVTWISTARASRVPRLGRRAGEAGQGGPRDRRPGGWPLVGSSSVPRVPRKGGKRDGSGKVRGGDG
jgi:hypothetical protein